VNDRPHEAAGSAPPSWRDPWAWASVLAVAPLALATRGAPRGEAVAEDFDFLRRALLEPGLNLLDGGGSNAFWRPVSHQLYYEAFGSLITRHPEAIAAIHVALLALGSLLLYRAFRRVWPGSLAAAAAGFPLMAESTRTLILWPSHFVDLGAFVFVALALHEAAFRRTWTACVSLAAALLCKELALVAALLLPFAPSGPGARPGGRTRMLMAVAAVIAAWAIAYAWVRQHAGLELPHGLERDPALLATAPLARVGWAVWNSLRATWSLPFERTHLVTAALTALALAGAAAAILAQPAARQRWRRIRGAVVWGSAWAVLSWAALASIFPLWAPNRSQLGSVGFGVAAVGMAHAVHPWLPALVTGARLALLAVAPGAPPGITPEPADRGAFLDYAKLVRLQRLMRASRLALHERFPSLPPGSVLGAHGLPLATEYAFGGAHAVEVWYRDTTLAWVSFDEFGARREVPVRAFLSYQPRHVPQVVLLDGPAVREALAGVDALRDGRWGDALASLRRAEAAQGDTAARVFRGDLAGRRAYCQVWLGAWEDAEREASFALAAASEDIGAHYVISLVHARRRDWVATRAEIDSVLARDPTHADALRLRAALDSLGFASDR
jgi:hypothetical protein